MRFNNILEEVLGSKPKIKILRTMLKVKAPLTGRKIAVSSKLNHRTCLLSLRELSREGFIAVRSAGKSKIYTLSTENIFLKESISKIFTDESRILKSLFKRIEKKIRGGISALILFGSVAEGREQPDSDIDICVVLKSLSKKKGIKKIVERERAIITAAYGNDLSPYYITKDNFIKKYRKKNRLIHEIAQKGKILAGNRFF